MNYDNPDSKDIPIPERGVWLYREVPLPSTLALACIGLIFVLRPVSKRPVGS